MHGPGESRLEDWVDNRLGAQTGGGAYQQPRFGGENRRQVTCFRCLNNRHGMKECQMAEHKLEAPRKRILARLQTEGAPAGPAIQSVQRSKASDQLHTWLNMTRCNMHLRTCLLGRRISARRCDMCKSHCTYHCIST
ncbi:MAG: hypothetical protein GY696_12490 [Gammaproteobacteria bacterium]|nr:hypothetical protein [Gammaproteobacteria bacterium]